MINLNNIDDIISKFLLGEASPEEAMELEDWKQESKSNSDYYASCTRVFEASYGTNAHSPVHTTMAWKKVESQLIDSGKATSIFTSRSYLRIAASIIVLIGIGSIYYYFFRSTPGTVYYASETSKTIQLEDATHIIIAPHSTITTGNGYGKNNRLLHLKGSAYFSVTHQEKLPFVVDAGNVFIKDIGTKFNISTSADNDTVYVRVDEGVVLLFDSIGSKTTIKATEKALYIKSKGQIKTDLIKPADTLQFKFTDSKLTDVVSALNKAYKVSIELENKAIGDCTITTRFDNEKIETILSVIVETLGFKYEKTQTGFIITGEKCNH